MWTSSVLLLGCRPVPSDSADEPADTNTTEASRFSVSGTATDLEGGSVIDMFVTVTTEFCTPDRTDEAGTFSVQEVSAGDKLLITYGETASNGLFASVAFPIQATSDLSLAEPVLAPALTESWPIDPGATDTQVVESTHGLTLTIEPGALSLAPFMESAVQVARVPVAQAPPFVPEGVALVDLFVLHPILSTFEPHAPLSLPADTGLKPGTVVTFHTLDYDTGLLAPVATGTVDAEGHPTTDPDQGIDELTWVALSVEKQ